MTPKSKKGGNEWVIKLWTKYADWQSIEDYIVWLQCGMKMNPFLYDKHRSIYHSRIFESVGYSRVSAPDKFTRALDNLLCDLFSCQKCSLTPNNEGFCSKCKRVVTIHDMVRKLKKLRVEKP